MLVLNEIESEAGANFLELMKANERTKISGLITTMTTKTKAELAPLADWMAEQKLQMSDFASTTLKESLNGGFTGKAATAASNYLTDIPQPNLQSPVK